MLKNFNNYCEIKMSFVVGSHSLVFFDFTLFAHNDIVFSNVNKFIFNCL